MQNLESNNENFKEVCIELGIVKPKQIIKKFNSFKEIQ